MWRKEKTKATTCRNKPFFHKTPLLLIAGEKDEIIPNTLTKKNYEAYKDQDSITTFKECPDRSHYICGEPGWEEIAVYAYSWLESIEIK